MSYGVKEHNHASEIARIINVDRSQSYRRLKGDVAWSHTDLRADCPPFRRARRLPAAARRPRPRGPAGPGRGPGGDPRGAPAAHRPAGAGGRAGCGRQQRSRGHPRGHRLGDPRQRRRALRRPPPRHRGPHRCAATRTCRWRLLEDDTRAAEALVEAFRPAGHRRHALCVDSASLRAAIALPPLRRLRARLAAGRRHRRATSSKRSASTARTSPSWW